MWDVSKCDLCGDCLVRCQYVSYDKEKAVAEIKALVEGREADILSRCVTCCGCREYCPTGADPYDLILKAQERTGVFPVSAEVANVFDLLSTIPSEVIPGEPDKPALSLCVMESQLPPNTVSSRLFEGMTIAKGGDYFCYIGYIHLAMETPIAKNAQKYIDNIAGLGKEIVFLHDDCYAMAHAKIKDYGLTVPFKYLHIFEYLRNYLKNNQGSIKKLNMKIAYQRPCASRYTPEKDAFLDEIFELIGVVRVNRKYDRETALCCSGPLINLNLERAVRIQTVNIEDAVASGANALVTLCPVCDRILRRPTSEHGLNKIFIIDLCRMAIGELG
jgi:hypothetical protein